MAGVKGTAGVFGHSDALIADAIESTTDIFSSFLVLFGIKYVNRPADEADTIPRHLRPFSDQDRPLQHLRCTSQRLAKYSEYDPYSAMARFS